MRTPDDLVSLLDEYFKWGCVFFTVVVFSPFLVLGLLAKTIFKGKRQ